MAQQEPPAPLARFLGKLEGVRHDGGLQYQARCPAHDDRNPSLSVWWGDKGKVVFTDQAGCEPQAVVDALGLRWSDLEQPKRIDQVYDYADVDGELAYQVVRYEPKEFRQRRPDPANPEKWIWSTKGIDPLPYNLGELAEALQSDEPVWITEGEKDAEALEMAYGVVATTNHGGAGKWIDAHSRHFIGSSSTVTIVCDRDVAGYRGAWKTYNSLQEVAGITAQLVHSAVGKDAADHVSNHGLDDFEVITYEQLVELKNAEEPPKNPISAEARSSGSTAPSSAPGKLVLRAAADIVSHRQKFLWEGRIPLGNLALFAGRGGVGKSTFAIWLAVEAQLGRLPGDLHGEQVSVLYVSVEDHWETQMKPRLIAAGANMSIFYEVAIGVHTDEDTGERIPMLPEDAPLIREAIEQTNAKLVILDPITSTVSGDDHKRNVVRAVLDPLAKIARETGAVIVGIMHFNKGGGNASDKASGSHAYRDAARSMLLFARDEDADHIVMSQDKGNYAEYSSKSLAYRLLDTTVELDDGDVAQVARVEIIGETDTSVSQIINRPTDDDGNEVVLGCRCCWRSTAGASAPTRGYVLARRTATRSPSSPAAVSARVRRSCPRRRPWTAGGSGNTKKPLVLKGAPYFPKEASRRSQHPSGILRAAGRWSAPTSRLTSSRVRPTNESDRTTEVEKCNE